MKGKREPVQTEDIYINEKGRTSKVVYSSYVVLLTEKDGSEVKAVRFSTEKKKGNTDFAEAFHDAFPDWENWNVKGSWRLYDDDFRE